MYNDYQLSSSMTLDHGRERSDQQQQQQQQQQCVVSSLRAGASRQAGRAGRQGRHRGASTKRGCRLFYLFMIRTVVERDSGKTILGKHHE